MKRFIDRFIGYGKWKTQTDKIGHTQHIQSEEIYKETEKRSMGRQIDGMIDEMSMWKSNWERMECFSE
jgi:hypothetical protein